MLTFGIVSAWIVLGCIVAGGLHLASDVQSTRRAIRRKLGCIAGVTKTTAITRTPNEWFAIVTVSRECDLIDAMQQALLRLDGPLRTKVGLSAAKTITITVEHAMEPNEPAHTNSLDEQPAPPGSYRSAVLCRRHRCMTER